MPQIKQKVNNYLQLEKEEIEYESNFSRFEGWVFHSRAHSTHHIAITYFQGDRDEMEVKTKQLSANFLSIKIHFFKHQISVQF